MKLSDDNPFNMLGEKEAEFRARTALNNIDAIFYHIDRRLEEISKQFIRNESKLEELEEAISHLTYLPSRPMMVRFNHETRVLKLQRNLKMQFEGNEADLLSVMFTKKLGKPKKKIFYYSEVAELLQDQWSKPGKPVTAKTIRQTVTRIKNRIELEQRLGKYIVVKPKEFYIFKY